MRDMHKEEAIEEAIEEGTEEAMDRAGIPERLESAPRTGPRPPTDGARRPRPPPFPRPFL